MRYDVVANVAGITRYDIYTAFADRTSSGGANRIIGVTGQIPFQGHPAPVAHRPDDHIFHMPAQVPGKAANGGYILLGEIKMLRRVGIVHGGQGADVATVQVKSRTIDVLSGICVIQNGQWIIRPIGVVIVYDYFSIYICVQKSRTEM